MADLPTGLESARLLPGWIEGDNRITALELVLSPGWKTYWRSPGDAGIPPSFEWQNDKAVAIHWPAPQVIDSAGIMTLGYADRVILPMTAQGTGDLAVQVELGLCDHICVPALLSLDAPPPGADRDAEIVAAMTQGAALSAHQPPCRVTEIADGLQLAVTLPDMPQAAAIELEGDIWISQPELISDNGVTVAQSDLVPPQAQPFALDPSEIVMTLIAQDGSATEYRGCLSEQPAKREG